MTQSVPENLQRGPVTIVDEATGELRQSDPIEATRALQQGAASLWKGRRVGVMLPDGTIGTADSADAAAIVADGGRLAGGEETSTADRQAFARDEGGGYAALAGLGRGATFGLTDQAFKGSPDATFVNDLREQNPYITGASELAGALVPSLAGGGLAALGERVAGAGAAKLGLGATASTIARFGAGGAVAGTELGVQQAVTEDALGDPEHTAQSVLAQIGMNALIGAAGGIVVGGAAAKLGKFFEGKAANEAEETVDDFLKKEWSRRMDEHQAAVAKAAAAENPVPTVVEDVYNKVAGKGASEEEAALLKEVGPLNLSKEAAAARAEILDAPKIKEQLAGNLTDDIGVMAKAEEIMYHSYKGDEKAGQIVSAVARGNEAVTIPIAEAVLSHVKFSIQDMMDDAIAFGNKGSIKDMMTKFEMDAGKLAKAAEARDNGAMYKSIDDIKRALQRSAKHFDASVQNGAGGSPLKLAQSEAVSNKLKTLQERLRLILEDEQAWGRQGELQKGMNSAWRDMILAEDLVGHRLTHDYGASQLDPFRKAKVAEHAKVRSLVNEITPESRDLTLRALNDKIAAGERFAKTALEGLELSPRQREAYESWLAAAQRAKATMADISTKAARSNMLIRMQAEAADSGVSALVPGIGGLLSAVVSPVSNPAKSIMQLARIERMMGRATGRIDSAAAKFAGAAEKVETAASKLSNTAEAIARPVGYDKASASVRDAVADPIALTERINNGLKGLDTAAPKVASAMATTALKTVAFLKDKLPPSPSQRLDTTVKTQPSDAQIRNFMAYYRGATNPMSVVEDIKSGRVSRQGVEAVKTLYPAVYEQIRSKVYDAVVTARAKGRPLSRDKVLQLGIIFDAATTWSLQPDALKLLQSTATGQEENGPKGGPSAANQKSAQAMMTTGQRLEQGSP